MKRLKLKIMVNLDLSEWGYYPYVIAYFIIGILFLGILILGGTKESWLKIILKSIFWPMSVIAILLKKQ
jgi:hypothetical protein